LFFGICRLFSVYSSSTLDSPLSLLFLSSFSLFVYLFLSMLYLSNGCSIFSAFSYSLLHPSLSITPHPQVRQRVLPPLLLQLKDVQLSVFALPSIFDIGRQSLTASEFERLVAPELRKLIGMCVADGANATQVCGGGGRSALGRAEESIRLQRRLPMIRCVQLHFLNQETAPKYSSRVSAQTVLPFWFQNVSILVSTTLFVLRPSSTFAICTFGPRPQTAGGDGNSGSNASSPSSAQAVPPQLSYVVLRGLDLLLTKGSTGFQRDYGTYPCHYESIDAKS
jgi:hypothetical protein